MARNEADESRFLIVYRFMWSQMGLSGVTLHVYARIYGFCQGGGVFFESRGATARFLGTTPRTVSRSISELLACGLIHEHGEHRVSGGYITRCYSVDDEAVACALSSEGTQGQDAASLLPATPPPDETSPPDRLSSLDEPSPPDNTSSMRALNPDGTSGDPVTGCHPINKGERKGS